MENIKMPLSIRYSEERGILNTPLACSRQRCETSLISLLSISLPMFSSAFCHFKSAANTEHLGYIKVHFVASTRRSILAIFFPLKIKCPDSTSRPKGREIVISVCPLSGRI